MSAKKSKQQRAEAVAPPAVQASGSPPPTTPETPLPVIGPSQGFELREQRSGEQGMPRPRLSTRMRWLVFGAIAVCWIAGFTMRANWLAGGADQPNTVFEGSRLLTTADAYFYASGVKNALDGSLESNKRVPGLDMNILVPLTAGVVTLFGWSVEQATLWMPAVLAPLVAIPIVLIGLMYGQLLWGFLAALISVLGFSYWNRTVPGYFDTDMVSIPYVLGVVGLIMAGLWRRNTLYGTLAAMMVIASAYIHPGSERVLAATALGAFGYAAVMETRNPHAYRIALALLIAFLPLPFWLKLILMVGLEVALSRVKVPLLGIIGLALVALGVVVFTNRAMDMVLSAMGINLNNWGFDEGKSLGVSFPNVGQTVAELQDPSLEKLGVRVAGGATLVITGFIGYALAAWRFRPMLMAVPLLALGTVLAIVGQRFTIFAVPVIALGNVWLALVVGRAVARVVTWLRAPNSRASALWRPQTVSAIVALALTPIALMPAIEHSMSYPPRTALTTQEASLLTTLGKRTKPGDFLIGWWDYAYGAWFHANVSTIVDGTKQNEDLWIAAEVMFTPSQRESAALMRLAVEEQAGRDGLAPVIDDLLEKFKADTGRPVSEFVPALRANQVALPKATREIYFYLPWRIIQILPNVGKLRPAKGLVPEAELPESAFLVMNQYKQDGTPLQRSSWAYDKASMSIVSTRGERVKVFRTTDVITDQQGRVRSRDTEGDPAGKVCVVNINHSGLQLFMDRAIYESTLSQLLFLVRPDPQLFEPVSYTRGGAIYRVKL